MVACLFGNTMAMEENNILVVGCRPWDNNVQGLQGLDAIHFVDFRSEGALQPVPAKFHHLDMNNEETNAGGNFSEFASTHPGEFKTIIFDWITYQHVRRDTAWADFATLLCSGGSRIVPITSQSMQTGASLSEEKAKEMQDKLAHEFNQIDILTYENMPSDTRFDLLRRPSLEPGRLEYAILPMQPAIIVATK
jgi:hypothetical protein